MTAPDCPHWFSNSCGVAGTLCDTDYVPTNDAACKHCLESSRPGPRQPNGVTASLALRWLRGHNQDLLRKKLATLQPLLECAGNAADKPNTPAFSAQDLVLRCDQSPGDVLTLTAAVYSLARAYPGRWKVAAAGTASEIWDHNPDITLMPPERRRNAMEIAMHYPAIDRCNTSHVPFLGAYAEFLGSVLGRPLPLLTNRPQLYLSDEERGWIPQVHERVGKPIRYAVVDAGVKSDYTLKQWPLESYQEVVDRTRHRLEWVQIGAAEHDHPPLQRVIDLRGQTSTRELIRLVYHADLGLGPVTFLQHLCAAWEKPYVCLLGGREPVTWTTYPLQHTLHTIGQLECCRTAACWRSRVVPLGDGAEQDSSLCERPVVSGQRPVGACMQAIRPGEVVGLLERLL